MGKMQAVPRHHLDQVAVAELVAQIPTNAQDDYLAVKMPHCKQLLDAPQLAHYAPLFSSKDPYIRPPASICTSVVLAALEFRR